MPENTSKTDRKAPRTAWKPGQSGNPGGRPTLSDAQRLAREMKAQAQPEAIRALVRVLKSTTARDADKVAAAKALLDGLESARLDVKLDTTDDTGLIEVMKRMASTKPPELKP